MISIKDAGKYCTLTLMMDSGPNHAKGMLVNYSGELYFVCNNPQLDGSRLPSQVLSGFKYAYHAGADGSLLHLHPKFLALEVGNSNVQVFYQKLNGNHFRRIYKQEGDLIFLGPICKDLEACKNPAAIITVMDYQYMVSKGWEKYEEKPSAERRAEMAGKNPKGV